MAKSKVLVVDDDAVTRSLLAAVLSDYKVDVVEAVGDDEAFQRFFEIGPDVILLDLLLPRHGGLALLRKLRGVRGGQEVPVLVMSAVYKDADVRSEAVERLGAVDFLKKPFQMDVLRARLSELLSAPEAGQSRAEAVFPASELTVRGDLATHDLPLFLKDLERHKTTARVHLRRDGVKKILFLRDGEVAFAVSNQIRETLGRHLFSGGLIGEEDYRAALDAMQNQGKRMGEFLVENGVMATEAVDEAIRRNVQEKVLDLFSWPEGEFVLTPYAEPPAPLPGAPLAVRPILWEGVRDRFPAERFKAALAPHHDFLLFPRPDAGEPPEAAQPGEELTLLRALRTFEGQPLGKVVAQLPGEAELRYLYFLLLTGSFVLAGAGAGHGPEDDLPNLERLRKARARLEALRRKNCFQVLEVPLDATDAKVRESYLRLAKEVHPDALDPGDPLELRRLHGELFQAVQSAYESLESEASRKQYVDFLQRGVGEEVSDGSQSLEAETSYMEGQTHARRRAWDAAVASFRRAAELLPNEGDYLLALGTALMKRTGAEGADLAEAERLLARAVNLLPRSPEPYFRLGQVAARVGDAAKAAKYYQGALSRSPNHVESQRELRLLRSRTEKPGGVLSSLFRKKEA